MASDRSWIGRSRYNEAKYLTEEYKIGVDNFIQFAIDHLREEDNGLMRCPCKNCGNGTYKNPSSVKLDLYRHGIMQWYTRWDCHREEDEAHDEVGTSSVNTNYRDDDDMHDAYDDDFEDCEDFEEEPNPTAKKFYEMVTWAGPHSKKGKGNKGNKSKTVRTSGVGDEESHIEGTYEVGESSQKIIFERKRRNCCEGDYPRKPLVNARPTVYFLKNQKGFKAPKPKKTLSYIVRTKWDEYTVYTKGAKREAVYNSCINTFKEYYAYPGNYEPEDGDSVVRAHLKRNFKQYLGTEMARLVKKVNICLDAGYVESEIDIKELRPHYLSQPAWNSICEY
ncbi:hypothetical protein POM88_020399 [Heracleum sosnowskyi]|uniref:Transposase-associated domain-containing protein n=1 Tax=Heracleum sosnowskyi TaxID=360622 RepID=A0AAD8ICR4_9APIA|nr:hypothetical protein POM88_020399 [Heracleum sosnowskyi]